jgi:hypothetical protein
MMICFSAKNFTEITMELIEFLDYYAKSFEDFLRKDIINSISSAFRECEKRQIIASLDYVLKEEKISSDIKFIFKNLIDTKENKSEKNSTLNLNVNVNLPLSSSALNINKSGKFPNQQNLNQSLNQNLNLVNFIDLDNDDDLDEEEDLNIELKSKENSNLNLNDEKKSNNKISLYSNPKNNNINLNTNINANQISEKKILEIEFFIHPKLSDLIDITVLNNFINYKSKKTFMSLIDNFLLNFLQKLKSKNLLESKLIMIDNEVTDIYLFFASFYLRTFKDELQLEDVNNFFNNKKISFDILIENNNNININNPQKEYSAVCNSLIDNFLIKYKNKNEKELYILIEIINKIVDLYPKFILRLFAFMIKRLYSMKIKRLQDFKLQNFNTIFSINSNINPNKIYSEIINKLFKDNIEYLKSRIRLVFDICINELNFEFLNCFISKGLIFLGNFIENDNEFISKILTYSSTETINGISNLLNGISFNENFNAFSFFTNAENLIKMIDISIDLTLYEQEKLWILINSTKNLNKILPFKDFISTFVKYLKNLNFKNEEIDNKSLSFSNFFNFRNMIFKNFSYALRFFYLKDIENLNDNPEKYVNDLVILFEIPQIFSENIYNFLKSFSIYMKKLPEIFSFLIEEFIKKYDNDRNKNFYFVNFLSLIKNFILFEKWYMFSILFDQNNYPLKHTLMRLNTISKVK